MNNFTISDIENLTRIKAHTLRVWEQRYNLLQPKRTETGHRYYDGEDLKLLLRVSWLYHHHFKISHIARFSEQEMKEKALGLESTPLAPEQLLNRLMEVSIDLDEEGFRATLDRAIQQQGFQSTMLSVVFPFLKKLGLFWLTGHVIPSQEHFASAIIIQKILTETDALPMPLALQSKRNVLLFTPTGEHHEIPILFVRYLMKKSGLPFTYMGSGVSLDTLKEYCTKKQVSELYFHLITNLTRKDLVTYLQELQAIAPGKPVYFSGLRPDVEVALPEGVHYLDSQEAILSYTQ